VYDTEKELKFPVLYWLHGSGGGTGGILPLSAHFDRAIRMGKIPPMLVVFANGLASSLGLPGLGIIFSFATLSPSQQNTDRVLYFGGFDSGLSTSPGEFGYTAWIYKGTLQSSNEENP